VAEFQLVPVIEQMVSFAVQLHDVTPAGFWEGDALSTLEENSADEVSTKFQEPCT
jgi:hypothetical protein